MLEFIKENNEVITIIGGALFSIIGFFIALFTYRRSILDALWQWTRLDGDKDVIDSRGYVYKLKSGKPINTNEVVPIINAYNHLGMLVRKWYIPIWYFKKNSTGQAIVNIYHILEEYIYDRTKQHNKYYVSDFVWLAEKLKKKYNKYYVEKYKIICYDCKQVPDTIFKCTNSNCNGSEKVDEHDKTEIPTVKLRTSRSCCSAKCLIFLKNRRRI